MQTLFPFFDTHVFPKKPDWLHFIICSLSGLISVKRKPTNSTMILILKRKEKYTVIFYFEAVFPGNR